MKPFTLTLFLSVFGVAMPTSFADSSPAANPTMQAPVKTSKATPKKALANPTLTAIAINIPAVRHSLKNAQEWNQSLREKGSESLPETVVAINRTVNQIETLSSRLEAELTSYPQSQQSELQAATIQRELWRLERATRKLRSEVAPRVKAANELTRTKKLARKALKLAQIQKSRTEQVQSALKKSELQNRKLTTKANAAKAKAAKAKAARANAAKAKAAKAESAKANEAPAASITANNTSAAKPKRSLARGVGSVVVKTGKLGLRAAAGTVKLVGKAIALPFRGKPKNSARYGNRLAGLTKMSKAEVAEVRTARRTKARAARVAKFNAIKAAKAAVRAKAPKRGRR